jgi:hypothetical protein
MFNKIRLPFLTLITLSLCAEPRVNNPRFNESRGNEPRFGESKKDFKTERLLTNPLLKAVDGTMVTATHIERMLWLVKEIDQVHKGAYKLNAQGEPDPLRTGIHHEIIFRGKKHTMHELILIEEHSSTLTHDEKVEFHDLFQRVKDYAEKVNNVLIDDARGTHEIMIELIKEFCKLYHRSDSELLEWTAGTEVEHYRRKVTTFKKLSLFSTDLMNFLACMIKSCPKALKAYKDTKQGSRAQKN